MDNSSGFDVAHKHRVACVTQAGRPSSLKRPNRPASETPRRCTGFAATTGARAVPRADPSNIHCRAVLLVGRVWIKRGTDSEKWLHKPEALRGIGAVTIQKQARRSPTLRDGSEELVATSIF